MNRTVARLLIIALAFAAPAGAAEKLRVGKAVPEAFSFVPLDIGIKKGFFQKYGVEAESIAFAGDAKLQQAMASDSIELALGSGPAMAFIVKGAPIKAIAAMAGPPLLLTLVVRNDDTVRTVADLKGRRVSVSTVGSLTYWLVSETSRQQGWGPKGIAITPMGVMPPQIAALERRETDGIVADISTALTLERSGKFRILMRFGDLVKDFHIHVIFATDKMIAERPDAMRGFLKGWFDTIAFMRANKAETVAIAAAVIGKDADITARTYDVLMPMFSDDGRFDPKALATLASSYVELGQLPEKPDMSELYTEQFLPAK
jgi:ABC-type nitrate/sulfonate/bicarbonate transport system substrate-binding protein